MQSYFDPGIEQAIRTALQAHSGQTRKGSSLPYATHPIHIALSLVRLGGSSEMVQAGLLHDVVEDCDDWTIEMVSAQFGENVAAWVGELTEQKGQSWEQRKQAAVDAVATMSTEAATIKAADKLHNLSSLVLALEDAANPDEVWAHFSRGPEVTIHMSELLVTALSHRIPQPLAQELEATLVRLSQLAQVESKREAN